MTTDQKSQLFTTYNGLRTLARNRVLSTSVDRVDRALGIVQAGAEGRYETTLTSCSCPDHRFRGRVCKHMLSLALTSGVLS
jgi:hypothetical protein